MSFMQPPSKWSSYRRRVFLVNSSIWRDRWRRTSVRSSFYLGILSTHFNTATPLPPTVLPSPLTLLGSRTHLLPPLHRLLPQAHLPSTLARSSEPSSVPYSGCFSSERWVKTFMRAESMILYPIHRLSFGYVVIAVRVARMPLGSTAQPDGFRMRNRVLKLVSSNYASPEGMILIHR